MSDLQTQISQATARILAAQQERDEAEKSAVAHEQAYKAVRKEAEQKALEHEQASRAARLRMEELKKEINELNTVLRHSKVQQTIDTAAAATKQALQEAEAAKAEAEASKQSVAEELERVKATRKEADDLLEKLKKQLPE